MTLTIIDTDTHVTEPADLWTSRMPSKWGDAIPHVRYVPELESEFWFVGGERVFGVGTTVVYRGADGDIERREDVFPAMARRFEDMHPSSYDPGERVAVMDRFGILAAVLYPNLGFIGPDIYKIATGVPLDFQVELARVYNDFILEWAQQYPGRFIPLACIPYWDVPSAVAEIERCAALGHKGLVTTGAPQLHGEPYLSDHHWDPVWGAAQDASMPISFHSGGATLSQHYNEDRLAVDGLSAMTVRTVASAFLDNGIVVSDLLMSGVLPRFPRLKFVSVESGIGWIPFLLETLDKHFTKYRVDRDRPEFTELPSAYFRRQVYANYWYEKLQPWHLEAIGADNLLFETDYPHPTCLLGDEIGDAIEQGFLDVSTEVRDKILWRNAAALYGLALEQ